MKITVGQISVDTGHTGLDIALDALIALLKQSLETDLSTALHEDINTLLGSLYDGTVRVG